MIRPPISICDRKSQIADRKFVVIEQRRKDFTNQARATAELCDERATLCDGAAFAGLQASNETQL